ncbi:MAG: DNA replication/repair protein RecF [Coxiellaceae bacterium]|nr:DNA replication/repair protein RecF [Coxiellaceae bacterium]
MLIQTLKIDNFRNISRMMLSFSPKFNAFSGDNAAGKTSILEAIYVLATAKSFRSSHHEMMIANTFSEFTLFSESYDGLSVIPIGFQRNREGFSRIHLRKEPIKSITEVSQLLPVLFIGSDSHRILMDGPKVRRQFLDWGLFHTTPDFLAYWRLYQKLLTHRNAALKARVSREEMMVWNAQLASTGEQLTQLRRNYINDFLPCFRDILMVFFECSAISTHYFPGWSGESSLLECLHHQLSREFQIGHTLSGPHRADLILKVDGLPVEEILSQGQQKLVSYALRLAQGIHFKTVTGKSPIFLIDDLPSELDFENQERVTRILQRLEAQVFITGIHQQDLEKILRSDAENTMFHVKHGEIQAS